MYNNTLTDQEYIIKNNNHKNKSTSLLTYSANNFKSERNKYDIMKIKTSLSNNKLNYHDTETDNITNKHIVDECEMFKLINNKDNLNTISHFNYNDKSNLNLITYNSDKEIFENLLGNKKNGEIKENLPLNKKENNQENENINSKNKKKYLKTTENNLNNDFNCVFEKNNFKKSDLLINENTKKLKIQMQNSYSDSNNCKKELNEDFINHTEHTNLRVNSMKKNKYDNYKNNKIEKINSNKFYKTNNKKNRHSHTSNPASLNEILSKISLLESIEEKLITLKDSDKESIQVRKTYLENQMKNTINENNKNSLNYSKDF